MKKLLALAIAGCLVAAIAGCGESPAGSMTRKVAEAPAKQDFQALTDIRDGQKNIYVIGKAMNDPYWQALYRGVKKSGNDAKANVYLGGVMKDGDWEVQQELAKELDGRKVDAVILGAADSVNMSKVAHDLRAKNIPVILVDTPLVTQDYDAAFMTDNLAAGAEAARQMVQLLQRSGVKENDKAVVVMSVGNMSSRAISERLDSALAAWHSVAPENWTISPDYLVSYGDDAAAEKAAAAALDNVQNIKGFMADSNSNTVAVLNAVTKAGRKDIAVAGFDRSKEATSAMKDGSCQVAVIAQHEYRMGYDAVKAALKLAEGETLDERDVDTGFAVLDNQTMK